MSLQLLVFNNIVISGVYIPFVYILFLIILPFDVNKLFLITSAFIIGTIQDIFSATIGIHSFATVFAAFIRPSVLSAYTPPSGYDQGQFLGIRTFGAGWFIKYALTLILIHAFILYSIDFFDLTMILKIIGRAFISSFVSLIFILAIQYGLVEKFR
jgi:rod shape-determining protein MreD